MKIGLRSVMRWFNLSVTQRMRDDYHNHVRMSERDYLMMECEEDAHDGRPVMFVAVSLVAVFQSIMGILYLYHSCIGAAILFGAGALIGVFGMFCMASTGRMDKPYYISDAEFNRIMEI